MTYLTLAGSRPSFLRPPTMAPSEAYAYSVSIGVIPSLVVRAQAEWILVPTKYRLSNTFAGSVAQVARSGAGPGATSAPGAVCGATHTRTRVPVKSKPAAAFAASR